MRQNERKRFPFMELESTLSVIQTGVLSQLDLNPFEHQVNNSKGLKMLISVEEIIFPKNEAIQI